MKYGWSLNVKCAMLVLCSATNQAWAGAFANEDLTAAGAGVANAVVASADDAAAAIYNPAGLAWQEGVQLLIGNHSRYRTLAVDKAGTKTNSDAKLGDLSYFALAWHPVASDWGASFAMSTPYAARSNWAGVFAAPTTLGEFNLDVQRYAADGFWRINNTLAVSLGVDLYNGLLVLSNVGSSFSSSQIESSLTGHLGLRWQMKPFWTFGATYRQASALKFLGASATSLTMQVPEEWHIGVMHDVADKVRLELDIKQSRWSATGNLNVLQNNNTLQSVPTNFRDATDVMLGATWYWRANTQFRVGYAFERSANQTDGFQPALADLTGHRLSLGFGGMMSEMHLDVAWSGVYYPSDTVTGAWAGTYNDSRYSLMFSLGKKF